MQVVIFGGFLGSGKTSLILSLAHYLVGEEGTEGSKLVILENEIGEVGIDNKVLQAGGYAVRELFAGCICCTLTADLVTTLNELNETIHPAWVIFEPTGLAYPAKIIETLRQYGQGIERIVVVSVVDAERWEELTEITPALVQGQVSSGDLVLINKCDLVGEESLGAIREALREMNPGAEILSVSALNLDSSIWRKIDVCQEV
ncbi:CobW family GTP-binding protein [Holophaga foetida]|uniref:CobW family GTP-binding protein n=1 Tax=Holophaga foetida TaxID=35839 RepID=UPI0002475049|nr:GTP-binding protein [Holophaga foetida]